MRDEGSTPLVMMGIVEAGQLGNTWNFRKSNPDENENVWYFWSIITTGFSNHQQTILKNTATDPQTVVGPRCCRPTAEGFSHPTFAWLFFQLFPCQVGSNWCAFSCQEFFSGILCFFFSSKGNHNKMHRKGFLEFLGVLLGQLRNLLRGILFRLCCFYLRSYTDGNGPSLEKNFFGW